MFFGFNKMLLLIFIWYKELFFSSIVIKLLGIREIEIMVKSFGDFGLYSVDEFIRKF